MNVKVVASTVLVQSVYQMLRLLQGPDPSGSASDSETRISVRTDSGGDSMEGLRWGNLPKESFLLASDLRPVSPPPQNKIRLSEPGLKIRISPSPPPVLLNPAAPSGVQQLSIETSSSLTVS